MGFEISTYFKLLSISFTVTVSAMFQFGFLLSNINSAQTSYALLLNRSHFRTYGESMDQGTFAWIWSAVVNCFQCGFLVGTVFTPSVVERYGRNKCLLFSGLFDIVGTAVQLGAVPTEMTGLLAFGRLVLGIGCGISSGAVTLYLQEISPTSIRGLVSSFQESSIALISLLGLVLGLPQALGTYERLPYLIAISFLPALAKLVLLKCPDTPKYIYSKTRNAEKTVQSILFYHGRDVVSEIVLHNIREECAIEEGQSDSSQRSINNGTSNCVRMFQEVHLRKALILGTVCFIAQECTGIVPIIGFSHSLLEYLHVDQSAINLTAILMGVLNFSATIVAVLLVEKTGRKKLLLSCLIVIIGLLIGLTICYIVAQYCNGCSWVGYVAAFFVASIPIVFGLGPGSIPWFITSELVPQSLRSTASSVTQVFNILVMFVVNFAFLPLFYAINGYAFVILLIVPTLISVVYLWLALPETKNREVSDIVAELKKGTDKAIEREMVKL